MRISAAIEFINEVRPPEYLAQRVTFVFAATLFSSAFVFADEVICPNDETNDSRRLSGSLTAEYDSKYIFRGVNSLPGSGLATTDAEFELYNFSLEVWQAAGLSKNYDELDFTVGYKYEKDIGKNDSVTLSAGYINYFTPDDDHLNLGYSDTQEIFASFEYDFGSRYTATLKYYYDFDKIRGGFIEPKFAACFAFLNNKLAFDPYVSITYDLQYNSNRFDWNNFQTGIEVVWKVKDGFKLSGLTDVSVPLAAIDQVAKKEGWVGLKATFDFK